MSTEQKIWDFLKTKGLTDFAVAGVMGNLYAESGLNPENLQNNFESILGMNDHQYTMAVDGYVYDNFVKDGAGYGLAQWTFWSRKQNLLNMARSYEKSVGDLNIQLEYLWSELQEFGLVSKLNAASSVKEASNLILFEFEKPFDTGTVVQNARATWSQEFYNKYHGKVVIEENPVIIPTESKDTYCVIALGKYADKATARKYMSMLQANGLDCFLTTLEIS